MFCSSSKSLKAVMSSCWGCFVLHIRMAVDQFECFWVKSVIHIRGSLKGKKDLKSRFTPTSVVLFKFIMLEFSNKPRHQFSSLDWRISTRFCHTVIALFTLHGSLYPAVLHICSACVVSGVIFLFLPAFFFLLLFSLMQMQLSRLNIFAIN